MVPSNTLSSTKASQFALKIIEAPIVKDYLEETHGAPAILVAHVPNDEDWWDTVDKASYAKVLSKRHKVVKYQALMDDKYLRWPDISTFNGPNLVRIAGMVIGRSPLTGPIRMPGRSEIYEIKPNNPRGHTAARTKLTDVETSYFKYGIAGIYGRGLKYPLSMRKTIYLETEYIDVFRYLVTLGLKPFGVQVNGVSIELTRPEAGVLLYKICVDLDGADYYQRDSAQSMAMFAIRMLWLSQVNTANRDFVKNLMMFLETMEPDDESADNHPKRVEPVFAGVDWNKPPSLRLKVLNLVGELESEFEKLRQCMYSRLIGVPGQRLFVYCDEEWYQTKIGLPAAAKVAAQIQMLTVGGGSPTARGASFIGLTTPVLLSSFDEIKNLPGAQEKLMRWAIDHPKQTIIILGVALIVTAAVIAIVASGGTAAAAAVPVTAEAMSLSAGVLATGEMTAGTMVASGVAESTVTLAVAAEETASTATTLVEFAHAAAQEGATVTELAQSSAQTVSDNLLIKLLSEPLVNQGVATGIRAASVGRAAVGVGVSGIILGVSARPAQAYSGPPNGSVSVAAIGELLQVDIGKLYIVAVNKMVPTQIPAIPELYKTFNINDYVPGSSKSKLPMRMLGCLEVQ